MKKSLVFKKTAFLAYLRAKHAQFDIIPAWVIWLLLIVILVLISSGAYKYILEIFAQ